MVNWIWLGKRRKSRITAEYWTGTTGRIELLSPGMKTHERNSLKRKIREATKKEKPKLCTLHRQHLSRERQVFFQFAKADTRATRRKIRSSVSGILRDLLDIPANWSSEQLKKQIWSSLNRSRKEI